MVGRDPLSVVDAVPLLHVDEVPPATTQEQQAVRSGPGSVAVPALLQAHYLSPVPVLPD